MKRSRTLRYLILAAIPIIGAIFVAHCFGSPDAAKAAGVTPAEISPDWTLVAVLCAGLATCLIRLRRRPKHKPEEVAVRSRD